MNKILLKHTAKEAEFYTDERCHIIELLNSSSDPSQSIAQARVEPGVTTALHKLIGTSEIYYILSGHGKIELGDQYAQEMNPSDLIHIPADKPQRITNLGKRDLIFLCICRPAFDPACYVDLEN